MNMVARSTTHANSSSYLSDLDELVQSEKESGGAAGLEDELRVPHEHAALTVNTTLQLADVVFLLS